MQCLAKLLFRISKSVRKKGQLHAAFCLPGHFFVTMEILASTLYAKRQCSVLAKNEQSALNLFSLIELLYCTSSSTHSSTHNCSLAICSVVVTNVKTLCCSSKFLEQSFKLKALWGYCKTKHSHTKHIS